MNRLFDKLFLTAYGLFTASFLGLDADFVMVFLLCTALSSFGYFLNRKGFTRICACLYGIGACFFPQLLLFLPLMSYDSLGFQDFPPLFLALFALLGSLKHFPLSLVLYLVFGLLLSGFLQYKTASYQDLSGLFRKSRDDSTERNFLLKEKNKNLIEKQDYEIYTATLRERNRIAREIHDNVGHLLSRSLLMVGAIKTVNLQESLRLPLEQLEQTLSGAMDCVRQSVHDLHDDSVNLKETVDGLVSGFSKCPILLDYDMPLQVPREIKYAFIAILKEALSNVIKHSNASSVRLTLRDHPGFYQMKIEDNGTSPCPEEGSGIGMQNMKDRIHSLEGAIQIRHEQGFQIFITVPKPSDC